MLQDAQTQFEQQLQSSASPMSEYFRLHTLPPLLKTLEIVKQKLKKEKEEEQKPEHTQSNILNIPNVSVFRNTHLQNSSSFMNTDPMLALINPLDLNVHFENEQENENNAQPVIKVEQQVQTDSPKMERKPRFRAKMGEIKVSVGMDGSTYYCCPECNLGYTNKADIDKHMQAHIQVRIC